MKYILNKEKNKIVVETPEGEISFWKVSGKGILQYPPNIRPDIESVLKRLGFHGEGDLDREVENNIRRYLNRG